jgi:hypothetical protein
VLVACSGALIYATAGAFPRGSAGRITLGLSGFLGIWAGLARLRTGRRLRKLLRAFGLTVIVTTTLAALTGVLNGDAALGDAVRRVVRATAVVGAVGIVATLVRRLLGVGRDASGDEPIK